MILYAYGEMLIYNGLSTHPAFGKLVKFDRYTSAKRCRVFFEGRGFTTELKNLKAQS